ncbi:MAG TPA: hypothetical protein VMV86_03535 [Methanosarcinales archaeon]|nr:hypothetical protein [Methanosarcinales archaeon]
MENQTIEEQTDKVLAHLGNRCKNGLRNAWLFCVYATIGGGIFFIIVLTMILQGN